LNAGTYNENVELSIGQLGKVALHAGPELEWSWFRSAHHA
jgi:hypothetical protein